MAVLSEENLMSFKNIDETARGRYTRISALMETLRCLFAFVVLVQSFMSE